MRIGIMLRHFDQHEGGVKVYTRNVLSRLILMDSKNHYVLMYQNPDLVGTFANHPHVEEVALRFPGKFLWDQVAVPWIARKTKVDIIFNMKLTIPYFSKARKVFLIHGSEKYVIPEAFLWHDRWYYKKFAPLYCRWADAIISVSQSVKDDVVRIFGVDPHKIKPVHNGYDPSLFHTISDRDRLAQVKKRYHLPDRFIFWAGQIYPPKNFGRLVQAFSRIKDEFPHHLVIAGEQRWGVKGDLELIQKLGVRDRVHLIGWVPHADLPVLYNLADLFVFPSLHEGFGIPLLEAMACGCPVLSSKTGAPPEVLDDAAYLVNPFSVDEISQGIQDILSSAPLREAMIRKGFERVNLFSWDRCAEETLRILESVLPERMDDRWKHNQAA